MSLLDNLFQVAYATNDLDRALAVIEERFGIKGLMRTENLVIDLDRGTQAQLRHALIYVGAMQFEVLQPVVGDIDVFTRTFPAAPGFHLALHHVCLDLESEAAFEAALAEHRARGNEVLFEGRRTGRSRFAFVDTRAQLGHMLELLHATPEGRAARAAVPRA